MRPELVREIAEDARAIRCPDRGADYPAYGFASLFPDSSLPAPDFNPGALGLHEDGSVEPWDPAPSLFPAD